MTTPDEFQNLLNTAEGNRIEFKSASNGFHFDEVVKYCVALANEGGGTIILGVSDRRPRMVVGTRAFDEPGRTEAGLFEQLRQRIPIEEYVHEGRRILIFRVPARLPGIAWQYKGSYLMRAGDALIPMSDERLRRIHEEAGPDFSAEICPGAMLTDIDEVAICEFRARWHRRAKLDSLLQCSTEQLLRDCELMSDAGLTYAAIILLGTHAALGRYLPHAEVVFEYRSSEAAGPANQREEFRKGILLYYDRIWDLVNLRNDKQHYQDGLFMLDVLTFSEDAVREVILNALSHRDYRHAGSTFIRQFPRRIEIVSPGGFPQGITLENILDRQQPRNRRIADALKRCGLVERAGQGANRIFESCIKEGKALPDFSHTDAWQVALTLHGQVQDPHFVRFLERVGRETATSFNTHEFLVLDLVHREELIPQPLQPRLRRLIDLGAIETLGRGKGTRYLLSRRFYAMIGQKGTYTRRKGLDDDTHKELLLKHLRENVAGSPLAELHQVLPQLSKRRVQVILHTLQLESRVVLEGSRRWARWKVAKDKNAMKSG